VSYACKPLQPKARRSALSGSIHQVFLLGFDGEEFWGHSFVNEQEKRPDSSALFPDLRMTMCVLSGITLSKGSHRK